MADPVLHIKDSFYFEVPKPLAPAHFKGKDFPRVWVKNDDQFQEWEAKRLYEQLKEVAGSDAEFPDEHELIHDWQHWQHEGINHGRPLSLYLESLEAKTHKHYEQRVAKMPAKEARPTFEEYVAGLQGKEASEAWFARLHHKLGDAQWTKLKRGAHNKEAIEAFKNDSTVEWSANKVAAYNDHLSGKILLYPQPFGDLRNMYEPEYGFNISKFMVLEVVVGILLFIIFGWVASKVRLGSAPKGKLWNLLEVFLLFIRDQVARPAIGASHDAHEEEHEHEPGHHKGEHPTGIPAGHGEGGAGIGGAPVEVSDVHHHGHAKKHDHGHHHNPYADADRFVPLLWTLFFFILFCNLFGAIPWVGAPTGAFGTTIGLALVTFVVVCIAGMLKFGVLGFFANQVPSMDLPWYMAIILKPMIFAIEMLGLLIKHLVLSIRLLANMVAGHLVILAVLGLAFGAEAALTFQSPDVPAWQWPLVATIAVVGSTLFNVLELFVAFLQAYVFTFLSALFIGAAVHRH
jgi:F-type H+-transporting ATPase subunit a